MQKHENVTVELIDTSLGLFTIVATEFLLDDITKYESSPDSLYEVYHLDRHLDTTATLKEAKAVVAEKVKEGSGFISRPEVAFKSWNMDNTGNSHKWMYKCMMIGAVEHIFESCLNSEFGQFRIRKADTAAGYVLTVGVVNVTLLGVFSTKEEATGFVQVITSSRKMPSALRVK